MEFVHCSCPPGPCEHYPYECSGRFHQFRTGTSGKSSEAELWCLAMYAHSQERLKNGRVVVIPKKPILVSQGPGTKLKGLMIDLRISSQGGCGCEDYAALMDTWGVEGCRQRRDEIIDHLKTQRKGLDWWQQVSIANKMRQQPWFKYDDPIGSLVDEAIRRAEQEKT